MSVVKGKVKAAELVAEPFYNRASDLTAKLSRTVKRSSKITLGKIVPQDTKVGIINIRSIKRMLSKNKKLANELNNFQPELTGSGIANDILALADDLSYEGAKQMRTNLLKLGDQFSIDRKNAPAVAVIKRLGSMFEQQIQAGLKEFSSGSIKSAENGKPYYKE